MGPRRCQCKRTRTLGRWSSPVQWCTFYTGSLTDFEATPIRLTITVQDHLSESRLRSIRPTRRTCRSTTVWWRMRRGRSPWAGQAIASGERPWRPDGGGPLPLLFDRHLPAPRYRSFRVAPGCPATPAGLGPGDDIRVRWHAPDPPGQPHAAFGAPAPFRPEPPLSLTLSILVFGERYQRSRAKGLG